MKRILARFSAVTAALAAPILLGAAPAHAATTADRAAAACGSGYYVQDSYALGSAYDVVTYLLYNTSSGDNCAVTLKTTGNYYYGSPTGLGAGIVKTGGSWNKDDAQYKYYAGPVYLHAAGSCVRFWGHDEELETTTIRNFYYTSPWEHCG